MDISFSKEVKKEILTNRFESSCCARAGLCAIIHAIGSLELSKGDITFSLLTDNLELLDFVFDELKKFWGEDTDRFETKQIIQGKSIKYEVVFPTPLGRNILIDCGIVEIEGGAIKIFYGINHNIIMEDCCKRSYISGAFAGNGTVSVPKNLVGKTGGGYHLEWSFQDQEQARDFSHILAELGFISKLVSRSEKFIVYLKESELISDILGMMGAPKSLLALQNEVATRDVRNNINRQANCKQANIAKSIESSIRQIEAIEKIKITIGIESLSDNLIKMAEIRLKYPQSSLSELGELMSPKLKKETVRFRLSAIEKIAKEL